MSYTVNDYKVTFRFKSRNTDSVKYFQSDRDLDILELFKQAMDIDGYNLRSITDVHIHKWDRYSGTWENNDVFYSLDKK